MSPFTRRAITGGFTVTAAVLLTASAAFGCVVFKGTLQVTGASQTGNKVTALNNTTLAHKYCSNGGPTITAKGGSSTTVSAAVTGNPTGTCGATDNKLNSAAFYSVGINDVAAYTSTAGTTGPWTFVNGKGCFASGNQTKWLVTATSTSGFTVDSTGAGSGSWTLPAGLAVNGPNDAAVFCIGRPSPSEGILAPFQVI